MPGYCVSVNIGGELRILTVLEATALAKQLLDGIELAVAAEVAAKAGR